MLYALFGVYVVIGIVFMLLSYEPAPFWKLDTLLAIALPIVVSFLCVLPTVYFQNMKVMYFLFGRAYRSEYDPASTWQTFQNRGSWKWIVGGMIYSGAILAIGYFARG